MSFEVIVSNKFYVEQILTLARRCKCFEAQFVRDENRAFVVGMAPGVRLIVFNEADSVFIAGWRNGQFKSPDCSNCD